ncbi:hypothetical protein [Gemmata sp.]|uniref:hypothetical protein n=1 Tax=Gemmata sp. TaxID=1914242 RepID=UPI003F701696
MGVVALPANLGAVADAADRSGRPARFEVGRVEVEVSNKKGRRRYRVAATDLRGLAVVEGDLLPDVGADGPDEVRAADASAGRALVAAAEFRRVFGDASRAGRDGGGAVLAALGENEATFGVADPRAEAERVTRLEQGRGLFPPVAATVQISTEGPPVASATVPAATLAILARIAAAFGDAVTIEFREPGRPLVLRAGTAAQTVTLIAQPTLPGAAEPATAPEPAAAVDVEPEPEPHPRAAA